MQWKRLRVPIGLALLTAMAFIIFQSSELATRTLQVDLEGLQDERDGPSPEADTFRTATRHPIVDTLDWTRRESTMSPDEAETDIVKGLRRLLNLSGCLSSVQPVVPAPARNRKSRREPNCLALGLLWRVDGSGKPRRVDFHGNTTYPKRFQMRANNSVTQEIEQHLRNGVLEGKGTVFLHQGLEDHDVWYHVRMNPDQELAKEIVALTNRHPNLYWLHWNPTLVDFGRGLIGPRVVPIPHFEALDHSHSGLTRAWADRTVGVAWRGTTTGFFEPYTKSDRYRVVKAFMRVPTSDVKFERRVQGVTDGEVPEAMIGGNLDQNRFSNYQAVLDVDGNANAWESLRWKLSYGCAVVKAESQYYIQWYYPSLKQGKHLWVSSIDTIVEQATLIARNERFCNSLSREGRKFAQNYLTPNAARDAIRSILSTLTQYSKAKDWRIEGTAPLRRLSPDSTTLLEGEPDIDGQMEDIRSTIRKLHTLRSAGPAGGSRLGGSVHYADGNGHVMEVVDLGDVGGRRSNPVSSIILEAARELKKPTFFHIGLEDHCPWYHVRYDPGCALSKGIVALTRSYPNFFWVHWNPTYLNESIGQIGERMVPVPHFEALQKDDGHMRLVSWKDKKPGIAWRGTTTGFANPYTLSDRYRVVKAFLKVPNTDVKFYSRCQGVDEATVPNEMLAGTMEKGEFGSYRVTLDIDGNANAWESLRWKLRSGSTVVKAKSLHFTQWYYPKLKHGEHLWVAPIEKIVEEAKKVEADQALCDKLAKNAHYFAEQHLSISAAREATSHIINHMWDYTEQKDWRPQGSA